MAHTDALGELIEKLHTDNDLQEKFKSDPAEAIKDFEITHHEHDAVLTRDLDDFVAIGLVHRIEELPEVLRGTREEEPHFNVPEELRDRLDWIRAKAHWIRPEPPEVPLQPEPGPIPRPGPGPDPAPGS